MTPVVQFVAVELGPVLANRKRHTATFHSEARGQSLEEGQGEEGEKNKLEEERRDRKFCKGGMEGAKD